MGCRSWIFDRPRTNLKTLSGILSPFPLVNEAAKSQTLNGCRHLLELGSHLRNNYSQSPNA
jgi:hypothetical protein